jgi:hypothetical protein
MRPYIVYFVVLVFFCTLSVSSYAAETCDMTDNGNGTVTDGSTGLTWMQCLEGQTGSSCTGTATPLNWAGALALDDGTWRVPNIKELQTIVDYSGSAPAINEICFPNTLGTGSIYVWSSSPVASITAKAWVVDFKDGSLYDAFPQTPPEVISVYTRLVCDGDSTACLPPVVD